MIYTEENKIEFKNWVPIHGNNVNIKDGMYLVTLLSPYDDRTVELASYSDGKWLINNSERYHGWKVIAFLKKEQEEFIPYGKPVQQFKKGDVIIWTNRKTKESDWMLIGSFDYQSDRAARSRIGKCEGYIYSDWVPNGLIEDARLASQEEIVSFCSELVSYYSSMRNGSKILELDLKNLREDLFNKIIEQL
jgi:hypothetical protein